MSSEVPLTLQNDLSGGLLSHRAIEPAMPVPTIQPSIEMVASMYSVYSVALGRSKLTSSVTFNDLAIVLDSHDCGPGIQDITPGCPLNVLHPLMFYTASRKVIYSAAAVQANSGPIALTSWSLPLSSCGEPMSLPTAKSISNFLHRCVITPLLSDLVAGAASIVAAAGVDAVSGAVAQRFFPAARPGSVSRNRFLNDTLRNEALSRSFGAYDPAGIIKVALGGLIDGASSYARGQANGTGEWSIKIAVGGPLAGVEFTYARQPGSAAGTYGLQTTLGPLQRTETVDAQGRYRDDWRVPSTDLPSLVAPQRSPEAPAATPAAVPASPAPASTALNRRRDDAGAP